MNLEGLSKKCCDCPRCDYCIQDNALFKEKGVRQCLGGCEVVHLKDLKAWIEKQFPYDKKEHSQEWSKFLGMKRSSKLVTLEKNLLMRERFGVGKK